MIQGVISLLNLVANLLMFIGGFAFYYNYLSHQSKRLLYNILRVLTALLLTGSFGRIIYDIGNLVNGSYADIDIIGWSISLSRNIGLGGILCFLTLRKGSLG